MKDKHILLVDIGNTSICIGLGSRRSASIAMRISTARCARSSARKAIQRVIKGKYVSDSVLCSVVPSLNTIWIREIKRALNRRPLMVNYKLKFDFKIRYPMPETIGPDRLADSCGAVYRYGFPVLIADFGTASTFAVVDKTGAFIGGVIAPGLRIMADYMAERTALLPRIKMGRKCSSIGQSTEGAMQIGALIGWRGLVREITHYLISKNGLSGVRIVATGGLAKSALSGFDTSFVIDQSLTMRGLYRIYQLNRKQDSTGGVYA